MQLRRSSPTLFLFVPAALLLLATFCPRVTDAQQSDTQQQCRPPYEAALAAIRDARLGRGEEQKLTSKVKNA